MDTIRGLVERFGGGAALARKLAGCTGETLSDDAVLAWVKRGRIPAHWHQPLLELARADELPLTAEGLIELATTRPAKTANAKAA